MRASLSSLFRVGKSRWSGCARCSATWRLKGVSFSFFFFVSIALVVLRQLTLFDERDAAAKERFRFAIEDTLVRGRRADRRW